MLIPDKGVDDNKDIEDLAILETGKSILEYWALFQGKK